MEPEQISPTYRENLAEIMQHALHQNKRRVRSTGEIAKNATGAREMADRVSNILGAYGIGYPPSDTTLRRWGNARVNHSFKGVGPQGLSEDALGRLAISLQIYPASEIADYDLSKLGEQQRMIRNAAIYAGQLLNRKGGADEWLQGDAAEQWLKGPVVGEHIKPAIATLKDVDLTVLSNPELHQLHTAVGVEFFKRTAYGRHENTSESHLPGEMLAAWADERSFEELLTLFAAVEPMDAVQLKRIMYEGEPMSEQHCKMAALLLGQPVEWLVAHGACAKSMNANRAAVNGDKD